jgi:hypothetical protein
MGIEEYKNRHFVIFDVTELSKIDFAEVLETSEKTVRKSVDGTKTFVKWEGDIIPNCILKLHTKKEVYTYSEILYILDTSEWQEINITI